jgi:hypothetical protein
MRAQRRKQAKNQSCAKETHGRESKAKQLSRIPESEEAVELPRQ